jgi:hypothetical protein
MPPPPLRKPRKRRDHRPTVIRNAFGQDPHAPLPQSEVGVPPFAGADATVESASAKIEGLVGGPMREMDVFSQASPPEVGDVFADTSPGALAEPAMTPMDLVEPERADAGFGGATPPPTPPPPSGPSDLSGAEPESEEIGAPPGEIRRGRRGDAVGPRRPQVTYGAPDAQNLAEQRRRSKLRRVPVLIAIMLLLIGGAVAASFYYVPVRTQVEGAVRFSNFDAITQSEQRRFQADQVRLLGEEMTRRNAQRILAGRHQDVAAGFLGDPTAYSQVANPERVAWPPSRGATQSLVLRYEGTDAYGDQYRMQALTLAVYDAYVNSVYYRSAKSTLDSVAQLRAQIDTAKRRRDDLYKEIDHQREIGDARPTPAQINSIQSERDQLERSYNQLIAQRKGAQADLERMKSDPAGAGPATQPVDLATSDAQLAQMQKDADALKNKVNASRAERAAAADGARKVLDAAVAQLQKEIDAAQPLITGENNELSGYVSAAQNLQSAIQQLTDEYVQRQQQQYAILADVRARRDQKIQARRSELWANDVQLRQLGDQKEITTRKLNTALAAGQDKDASDLQNDLKLIENSIKARQDVLANDPLYADEINQLQASYEKQEKAISEDRQHTNERLASLAKTFTQMQPAVERLPDNQNQVASTVHKRLSDLSQARNVYVSAFDAASAGDDDTSVRQAVGDLQALLASIEARKKQLLIAGVAASQKQQEQSRQSAIAAKEAEVARLIKAESDAQAAFMNKNNELLKAQAQVNEARSSGEKMLQMQRELDTLDRQLEQNNVALSYKERDAKRIVEAVQPNPDTDVVSGQPIDQRWMYAAGSSGAVLLIFSCWILLTLLSAAREANYPYASFARATDQGPVPADENRKPLNGSQEEESEPAVV